VFSSDFTWETLLYSCVRTVWGATINNAGDLAYLGKQAQEDLKSHTQERLPEQYQKCMIRLNQVLKRIESLGIIFYI
jgi:hypothetical protein